MKDADLFFPSWTIVIYMPLHIYYFFELAALSYAPRSIGYASFPILIFGFFLVLKEEHSSRSSKERVQPIGQK